MLHEDVIALIKAGFTADEIRAMEAAPAPEPDPEPAAVPEPAPAPEPEKPAEPDRFAEYMRSIEALRQEVENLRSTFSAAAVRQDNINQPAQETVSDVLASIINPRTKKEV